MTELIKVRDDSHKRRQYMNRNITWSLPKLKPYVPDHVVESDEEDTIGPAIAPQLQKKLDEELQVPQVIMFILFVSVICLITLNIKIL